MIFVKHQPKYRSIFTSIGCISLLGIASYLAVFYPQNAGAQDYVIRGFDVSHHQGEIDWKKSLLSSINLFISKPLKAEIIKMINFRITG